MRVYAAGGGGGGGGGGWDAADADADADAGAFGVCDQQTRRRAMDRLFWCSLLFSPFLEGPTRKSAFLR